ncbi:murein hydrolase activator EnvC [Bacillus sp. MRMR6]|uniref:murein hydrolase activator EnvC family protein n=1 Tax=Bacillus sp. MRMR6 TaxID=1928617 RepID=UPI0009513D2C|nr:peptidoglycan DD-metalloendopeptidase family protein [Bacillus sp. MRMR6]OLS37851.1 peptidase M23 [Bacillus sp. MRMR6]
MKKYFVILTVVVTVGFSSIFNVSVNANSIESLKEQQSKIQNDRSEVNSTIEDADVKINSLQEEQSAVKTEMQEIDLVINETHKKISEKTSEIESKKTEIAELQEEIRITKERIEKRNELLKERARNYQVTGGMVSYIDVLMGSKSFSDFIDRANAVATIMQADQDIIKQHEEDKKNLETYQAQVEKDLDSLQTLLAELETMNQQLNSQRAEKDRLLASLEEQEEELHHHKMELQEEAMLLAAQAAVLQQAIKQEQKRQAEAAAAAAAAGNQSPGSGNTSTSPAVGGSWAQPANGIFTSGFGTRPSFRPGEFHYGVDIANRAPGVPIWAAADGIVIRSYYSSSYGNAIFIAHSINGQTYTTVYAHLETRFVQDGAVVKAGQQIGILGSTGDSTGPHLHFELHRGEWLPSRANAIDPRGIVPLP